MKYVLAYSWNGSGIDVFYGETETKCIVDLTSALLELSVGRTGVNNERELDRLAKTIKDMLNEERLTKHFRLWITGLKSIA